MPKPCITVTATSGWSTARWNLTRRRLVQPAHAHASGANRERRLMGRRSPKSLKMFIWRKIMRSTPTRLLFRRKITAVFADGSSKMNLGIATVVRMLKGAANVPVEVAADAAARELHALSAAIPGTAHD